MIWSCFVCCKTLYKYPCHKSYHRRRANTAARSPTPPTPLASPVCWRPHTVWGGGLRGMLLGVTGTVQTRFVRLLVCACPVPVPAPAAAEMGSETPEALSAGPVPVGPIPNAPHRVIAHAHMCVRYRPRLLVLLSFEKFPSVFCSAGKQCGTSPTGFEHGF